MTVVGRSEIRRSRLAGIMGLVLGGGAVVYVLTAFSESTGLGRAGLAVFGVLAVVLIVLSLLQIVAHWTPTKAVIFREGDQTIVATNRLTDTFKLRFFREVLGEYMVALSDEDRERWNALEQVGFHVVFNFHNVRKTLVLPLSFMVFDEVFVMDHTNRWDYFDCRNTSEPTSSQRGVAPFADDSVLANLKKTAPPRADQARAHSAAP